MATVRRLLSFLEGHRRTEMLAALAIGSAILLLGYLVAGRSFPGAWTGWAELGLAAWFLGQFVVIPATRSFTSP